MVTMKQNNTTLLNIEMPIISVYESAVKAYMTRASRKRFQMI